MWRPLYAARALALAIVLLNAGVARATAAFWSDPSGRYSLDFASLGWESVTPRAPAVYLAIESIAARQRGKFLTCSALVLGPLPGSETLSQAQVNVGSERFEIENARRAMPGAQSIRIAHGMVEGVAVVDIWFVTPADGGLYHRSRTFYLATPSGAVQHQIHCGGAMPVSSQDEAEIAAVLETLHFLPVS